MPEAAARREAFTAARFTPETSLEAAFVAYATRAQVQRLVADEALESETAFYQASQALEARHAAELAQVIKETRARREAQLERELERTASQLDMQIVKLSGPQLVHATVALAEKAANANDRASLKRLQTHYQLLHAAKGAAKEALASARSAGALNTARSRLELALNEAETRVRHIERQVEEYGGSPLSSMAPRPLPPSPPSPMSPGESSRPSLVQSARPAGAKPPRRKAADELAKKRQEIAEESDEATGATPSKSAKGGRAASAGKQRPAPPSPAAKASPAASPAKNKAPGGDKGAARAASAPKVRPGK